MNKKDSIYTCIEHVEIGIDDFVNYNHQAPDLEMIEDEKCDYCEKKAVYMICIKR
ncbi:MAG: CxxH/CxxC protein [Bacillota bacterium]|nr:CxxH/CxxC protein [Bacillota bacterium]